MSNYQRAYNPGGCYFFTVVTHRRLPFFSNSEHVQLLRDAFRETIKAQPFVIDAIVVLPNHMHSLWRLPSGDADFSNRWREIKKNVSRNALSSVGPVWQRRFWEHLIRDEDDWRRHMDYIHYNPVKHGHAETPSAWPYSSFSRCVERGLYETNWAAYGEPGNIADMQLE